MFLPLIPPRPPEISHVSTTAKPIQLHGITHGTEPTELLISGRHRLTIPNGAARLLSIRVTGRTESFTTTYGASILVVARNTGGLVALSNQQMLGPVGTGGAISLASAPDEPGALSLLTTGEPDETMIWAAEVELIEARWPHFLETFQPYDLDNPGSFNAAWPETEPSQPWHNQNPVSLLDRDPRAYPDSTLEVTGFTIPEEGNGTWNYDGLFNNRASFRRDDIFMWFEPAENSYIISYDKGIKGTIGWTLPGWIPDGSYLPYGTADGAPVATPQNLATGNLVLFSSGGLRKTQFTPISASDAAPLKWSFRFYDPYDSSDPKSGREYAELRRDNSFVIFAAGLHNTVNSGTYSLPKYQFRNVGGAGWIQLDAPRSRGWHLFEVIIRHSSLDVYVDGKLDPNGTNLAYAPGPFDTIHLGSLIQTNTPLYYDNVTLGRV